MADIARYPFIRHLRGATTTQVQQLRNGQVVRADTGASFWFRPLTAVLSEVPVDDREVPLLFHGRTADFQDVTVQATLTFRFTDPAVAAARVDFSIDPDTGRWRTAPLDQVAGLLAESAQQQAVGLLAAMTLTQSLTTGIAQVREAVTAGLRADERLVETGIAVIGVRVVAIRPEPELEKALQTPTREQVQQEADRATYERRALAVERERAISENELQSRIELARREEQLVEQNGENARRGAEASAVAREIDTESQARSNERLAVARAEAIRVEGAAQAEADTAQMRAVAEVPQEVLYALALKELAAHVPDIDSLVLTPDLIAPLLARLGAR